MEDLHEPDELEDSVERDSSPTAEEIVSSRFQSGTLSPICGITMTMRDVDTEEDMVKTFVERGCGCDVGPKSPLVAGSFQQTTFSLFEVQWLR